MSDMLRNLPQAEVNSVKNIKITEEHTNISHLLDALFHSKHFSYNTQVITDHLTWAIVNTEEWKATEKKKVMDRAGFKMIHLLKLNKGHKLQLT